jgi:pilus assembly protein Flp/PilA
MFKKLWKDESGQGMVEYALIIAVVAIIAIAVGPRIVDLVAKAFSKADVGDLEIDTSKLEETL